MSSDENPKISDDTADSEATSSQYGSDRLRTEDELEYDSEDVTAETEQSSAKKKASWADDDKTVEDTDENLEEERREDEEQEEEDEGEERGEEEGEEETDESEGTDVQKVGRIVGSIVSRSAKKGENRKESDEEFERESLDEDSGEDIYTERTDETDEKRRKSREKEVLEEEEQYVEDEEDEIEGELLSGPYISEKSTVPWDVLVFYHSFGYDCRRHYNLCIPDPETVIFASGNYINFLNIKNKKLKFRRSAKGGGIGHIAKNPKYPHVAVAEKGLSPYIIIYEWPSMDRVCILRRGTTREFTSLHYSIDGKYLCSQGGEPDYFLTVWNWKRAKIVRQQKAYGQEVYNAMFSDYSPGNLTTAGYGHIKFWKLARTFTGLKLMGSIGRFGKTEMCDIIGFVALPDEQVVSGCEWGNMLIWNEGLVKAEICRKNDVPCHDGYISQLLYDDANEEIISVGTDGFVRAWDFKLIERADLSGDEQKIRIENLHALEVGKGPNKSQLLYIEKQEPDPEKTFWFAQDGNGGIWLIDLDQDHPANPEKIFSCHAGGIRSIAACPNDNYIATYGDDGRVIFYNYITKKTILVHKFAAGGGFMIWPTTDTDPTGTVVMFGGADGMVRVVVVALREREAAGDGAQDDEFVRLIQTTKPHVRRVTYMAVHRSRSVLVTGSEDATVFVYQIATQGDYISLNPIGFVRMPSGVTHMAFKHVERPVLLVSCSGGQVLETDLPDVPTLYTKVSYELTDLYPAQITFVSVKSQIRRDIFLEEVAKSKEGKLQMKKQKLEELRKENPNVKIDEELFLEDSDSSISLESLYFPPVPSPILFSLYLPNKAIWVSPGGYDAGYMYVYKMGYEDPIRCKMIADADDIEIHSYIYDPTGEFLILGMQNGKIRVCRINLVDYSDLSDYWELALHDNDNGIIPQMCYSFDKKVLFTCGRDGNVFAFTVTSETNKPPGKMPLKKKAPWPANELEDISNEETYSLEQLKEKAENDRKNKVADSHKEDVLKILRSCKEKFAGLLEENDELPLRMRVPEGDFIIDHRIEDDLEEELERKMDLEKRKLAFEEEKSALCLKKVQDYFYNVLDSQLVAVYGINDPKLRAYTFRHKTLPPEFLEAKNFIEERLRTGRKVKRSAPQRLSKLQSPMGAPKPLPLGTWLKGLSSMGANVRMNVKLQRMLLKYYERKRKNAIRQNEWNDMMRVKPDPKVSHPDDVAAVKHAESTIGDYKMKTDPNYTVLKKDVVTTDTKFQQLLLGRERVYALQKEYNDKVYGLRDKKVALIKHIADLHAQLTKQQEEIPTAERKTPPPIPQIIPEQEFAELELKLKEEDVACFLSARAEASRKERLSPPDYDEPEEEEEPQEEEEVAEDGALGLEHDDEALDSDYEALLVDARAPPPVRTRKVDRVLFPYAKVRRQLEPGQFLCDADARGSLDDSRDTPWEKETRFRWMCRSLYMQDKIIKEMEDMIADFDKELTEVKDERFKVAVEVKFGELQLLQIHQEIIILKDYEATEDTLAMRVHQTEDDIHAMENKIADTETRIENHKKEIEHLNERERQLLAAFNEAIEDNPFAEFLRKIYKKKYKPPKEKRDEDESSSSSSSESESTTTEDEGSLDSEDIGVIKLDESICPPDLDRDLYDLTFRLRSERHGIEIRITEEKKQIEVFKKDIEFELKKSKGLVKNLENQKSELLEFQREKQRRLNEVQCVVALKASQLQYFEDPAADLVHMDDKLVFSHRMLGELTNRVGELQKETVMQKNKLRRYRKHHFRMQIDCKHMQSVINELKLQINDALVKKFGSILQVDELEDILLQRLINEMKSPLQDIKEEFHRVAAILKAEIRKTQNLLSKLYINNSEKLNVLTILEKEKYSLNLLIAKQGLLREGINYSDLFLEAEELKKLRRLMKKQEAQIENLKEEIKRLGYKGQPPPPICTTPMMEEALKRAKQLAAQEDELPEIADEEEDENMFLYMESTDAVQMVAERSSLDDVERLPSPQYILEELLRRVSVAEDVEASGVLDSAIQKLINKIPPTDDATCILDEVLELLNTRLAAVEDPEGLRNELFNIVHDLESMRTGPADVKGRVQSVFEKLKAKEAEMGSTLDARAIVYDVLRKCVGFVMGRKFFLATEEAMLDILDALDEDEVSCVVDEVLTKLLKKYDEYAGQPAVQEVLEDVIHHLHSLEAHETVKEIFDMIFKKMRERMKPERDVAVARTVLHDTLKKAIGIVAETLHPITEREFLQVDKAILMLVDKLGQISDTIPFFDEVELELENRDLTIDTPYTQDLVQGFAEDIDERPPMDADETRAFFEKVLKRIESSGAGPLEKLKANSVVYNVVRRAIGFAHPEVDCSDVFVLVDPAANILSLLDKIPSDSDTTDLFDDVLEELSEKNKEELFSEGVETMLPHLIQKIEEVEDKTSSIKDSFSRIMQSVKEEKTHFIHDITSILKMLQETIKNSMEFLYPHLTLDEDEDITDAQRSIQKVLEYITPDTYSAFVQNLGDVLEEWRAKKSDPPDVEERIKEVVLHLRTAPVEPKRIRRLMSAAFKMIDCKGPSKDVVLRILSVLKYGIKDALRTTLPDVDIPVEHIHFDPDESTLAMLLKVPKSVYLCSLNDEIREQMNAILELEKGTPEIKKLFNHVIDNLSALPKEEPEIYKTVSDSLEEINKFDVQKIDIMYARIYLNDAVRKAITTVFPRLDLKPAVCCMDKHRPTWFMIEKLHKVDDILVLYDEIREELQTKFETIENDPDVHSAIHDALLQFCEEPKDVENAFAIFYEVSMRIHQKDIPRLATLTANNIYFMSVKKCIELVFPYLDVDDTKVLDKEFPIVQMFRQIPDKKNVELVEEIRNQLQGEEDKIEKSVKPLLDEFIDELSEHALKTGVIDFIYPCLRRIEDSGVPVKDARALKEVIYQSVKKAIQKLYPDVDLQDNQTAWENEESILLSAQKLPDTDDTSEMIDHLREHLDIIRESPELTDGSRQILQEIENHLTVMPLDKGGYEYAVDCIFSVLRSRRGEARDLAQARSNIYKILRKTMEVIREKTEETESASKGDTGSKSDTEQHSQFSVP